MTRKEAHNIVDCFVADDLQAKTHKDIDDAFDVNEILSLIDKLTLEQRLNVLNCFCWQCGKRRNECEYVNHKRKAY